MLPLPVCTCILRCCWRAPSHSRPFLRDGVRHVAAKCACMLHGELITTDCSLERE
jgi:hypothetical protein